MDVNRNANQAVDWVDPSDCGRDEEMNHANAEHGRTIRKKNSVTNFSTNEKAIKERT
jgi:hypothetical protein